MGGSLYWRDLISLVQEVGFSTPHLVSASHIEVFNCELKKKADVALQDDGEMAAILQCSRFSPDFCIQKYGHVSPFLLADKLGSSVKQCSKTGKAAGGCEET
ncbi:unnamed protein product [Coregonus sp. 'balchen']|nr:unnamed protein product [Coregonus sp. 'balchen']